MTPQITRRSVLGLALAASATGLLAACAGGGGSNTGVLRVTSYGDPTKLALRGAVVDKFQLANPDIKLKFEGTPATAYFDKLATQISAGSPPDIINMDPVHMAQYAANGVLAPLDKYVPKPLRTDGLDKNLVAQGVNKGKLYGVPFAVSTYGIGWDETKLGELGITLSEDWTYQDYADVCLEIHKAGGDGYFGSEDMGGDQPSFEVWLRANGQAMYKDGKEVGFDQDTLEEWFSYWDALRKNGGATPADIGAQYTYDDNTGGPIGAKKVAMQHIFTPNFAGAFQALTDNTLKLMTPPVGEKSGKHGTWQAPSSVLTVSAKCKDQDSAAKFIDFFVNSEESAKVLRFISGPFASTYALKGLEGGDTTPAEAEVVRYSTSAPKNGDVAPPLAPASTPEIAKLMLRTNQDVGFGSVSIKDAAKSFIDSTNGILAK